MSNDDNGGLLEKALKNIENDRQRTSKLLTGLEEVLQCQPHDYKDLGTTAAKFVETLQRSNEQLVKLIGLRQKDQDKSSLLSDEDKHSIFDLIQGDATNAG